jgi:hypothetical protein
MSHDTLEGIHLMLPLMGALTALVCGMIGYIGNKLYENGTRLYEKLDEMSNTLRSIEADLRKEINGIDRRVTRLESISKIKGNLHLFQDREGDQ